MSNEFLESQYWNEVSGETEHFQHQASLVHGKVAVAAYWPFLSGAINEADYENRFSVVSDKIASLVAPEVYPEVVESLREDYRAVQAALQAEAAHTPPHIQVTDRNDGNYITEHVFSPKQSERLYAGPSKDDALDYARKTADVSGHPIYVNDTKTAAGRYDKDNKHLNEGEFEAHVKGLNQDDDDEKRANDEWDKKHAYIDPDDKRRYDDYPDLNPPLNNGALQGPDGFVEDLAQGEHAGADEKWKLQLTPGVWHNTPGTAMPERPMEMSKDRGYQPVASQHEAALKCQACGNDMSPVSQQRYCSNCTKLPKAERDAKESERWGGSKKNATLSRNGHDFNAGYGHGVQDASAGHDLDLAGARATAKEQKLNPDNYTYGYHRGHGDATDLKSKGYVDPWRHSREASSNWGHDTSDHGEYSFNDALKFNQENYGTHVASVEFFDQESKQWKTALVDPAPGQPVAANPFFFDQATDGLTGQGFPTDPWLGNVPDRVNEYGDVQPQVSSGSEEGTVDGKGYSRSTPGESPNFNVAARVGSYRDIDEHGCPDCGAKWTTDSSVSEHPVLKHDKDCPTLKEFDPFHEKTASTNGRIVGHCPGCNESLRQHDTMHGTEFRHLHNNSVRCNFQPEASKHEPLPDDEAQLMGQLISVDKYKHDPNGKQNFVDGYADAHSHARNGDRPNHEVGVDMNQPDSYNDGYAHGWYHATGERSTPPTRVTSAMSGPGTDYPTWDSSTPEDSASPGDGEGGAEDGMAEEAPELAALAGLRVADYNIERPTPENPTGRGNGDEYNANTFDNLIKQRPMQSAEDRGINTPVKPQEPIKTTNFNTPGGAGGNLEQSGTADDEDEEDD